MEEKKFEVLVRDVNGIENALSITVTMSTNVDVLFYAIKSEVYSGVSEFIINGGSTVNEEVFGKKLGELIKDSMKRALENPKSKYIRIQLTEHYNGGTQQLTLYYKLCSSNSSQLFSVPC